MTADVGQTQPRRRAPTSRSSDPLAWAGTEFGGAMPSQEEIVSKKREDGSSSDETAFVGTRTVYTIGRTPDSIERPPQEDSPWRNGQRLAASAFVQSTAAGKRVSRAWPIDGYHL